jgi:hypothetical protein
MLQRSRGMMLIPTELAEKLKVKEAVRKLDSIRTYVGFVVDTMGFGKTFTVLAFLNLYARYAKPISGYRP